MCPGCTRPRRRGKPEGHPINRLPGLPSSCHAPSCPPSPLKTCWLCTVAQNVRTLHSLRTPVEGWSNIRDPKFDCIDCSISLIYCCLLPSYAGPIAAGGPVDRRCPRRPGAACMAAASAGCAVQHTGISFRGAGRLGLARCSNGSCNHGLRCSWPGAACI
jgi:hypothetical protein